MAAIAAPGHRLNDLIQSPPAPLWRRLRLAMILQYAAGGAVLPFVTLWFRDRGLSLTQISLSLSAASATLLVFPFLWGMLADRYVSLNRLFTFLSLLSAAALMALALAADFTVMLLMFLLYYACFAPTLSLISALCFHHLSDPREHFGKLRAWGSLGWILPFLPISIWLAQSVRVPFDFVLFLGIGIFLAMALLTFWLPETPPGAAAGSPGGRLYWPALRALLRDPNYLALLASFFLISGSFSLSMFYAPLYLEDVGIPRPWIGPVQAIGVVFEIVLFQWQPFLLRRWNYAGVILTGCCALLARHLLFAWVSDPWILSLSYLLAGMVIVFYHIGVSVLVNAMATREVRASAQTLLVFCSGLGPMCANAVAGRLGAGAGNGLRLVFLFGAGFAGLAALLIAWRGGRLNDAGRASVKI